MAGARSLTASSGSHHGAPGATRLPHHQFGPIALGAGVVATAVALVLFPWAEPTSAVWLWDTSGGSTVLASWVVAAVTSIGLGVVMLATLVALRAKVDAATVIALGAAGGVLLPLVLAQFQNSALATIGLLLAPASALIASRSTRLAIAAVVGHLAITAFTANRATAWCDHEDCFRSQPWSTAAGLALLWFASVRLQRAQAEAASSA